MVLILEFGKYFRFINLSIISWSMTMMYIFDCILFIANLCLLIGHDFGNFSLGHLCYNNNLAIFPNLNLTTHTFFITNWNSSIRVAQMTKTNLHPWYCQLRLSSTLHHFVLVSITIWVTTVVIILAIISFITSSPPSIIPSPGITAISCCPGWNYNFKHFWSNSSHTLLLNS